MGNGNETGLNTFLFDLDGTLVDSAPTIGLRLSEALVQHGYGEVDLDTIRPLLGNDAAALVAALLTHQGTVPDAEVCALIAGDFLRRYRDDPLEGAVLYPGCLEVLKSLSARGCTLAICTNKPEITALPVLAGFGLMPLFSLVACGDIVPVKKPDAAHIRYILDKLHTDGADALMIGDSSLDVIAARNASVTSILVRYGYDPHGGLAAKPDHVVDNLDEIVEFAITKGGHRPRRNTFITAFLL